VRRPSRVRRNPSPLISNEQLAIHSRFPYKRVSSSTGAEVSPRAGSGERSGRRRCLPASAPIAMGSYADAKDKVGEMKDSRKAKKAEEAG
jgi:hypothetical protein